MGIRSTRSITRQEAIDRITAILHYVECDDWHNIERTSEEGAMPSTNIWELADNLSEWIPYLHTVPNIKKWTNTMLETVMDCPYIRFSLLDNYQIGFTGD